MRSTKSSSRTTRSSRLCACLKDGEYKKPRLVDVLSILQIAFNVGQYEGAQAASSAEMSLVEPEHFPYLMPPFHLINHFVPTEVADVVLSSIMPAEAIFAIYKIISPSNPPDV